MMDRSISFSVVLPTFNSHPYVIEALDSVLAQGRADAEIIVVDDGSTDGTAEALRQYEGRVKLIVQENRGPAAARNRALAEARGEWIAFQDSDDRWLPGHLATLERAIRARPDAAMFVTDSWVIDEPGRRKKIKFSRDFGHDPFLTLLMNNTISTPGVAVKRRVIEAAGGFFDGLRSGQDWDLWLRIAYRHHVVRVPTVTIECRRRAQSTMHTRGVSTRMREDNLLIMERVRRMAPELTDAILRTARARCWADSAGRMIVAGNTAEARRELWGALAERPTLAKAWLYLPIAAFGPRLAGLAVAISRRKETSIRGE